MSKYWYTNKYTSGKCRYISDFLFACYNASVVKSSEFPSILTPADIIPVFKKDDKECKNNYRPVSILSNMSKIF